MMMIVTCAECHKEGQLDTHLTFTYKWETCNLGRGHSSEWSFSFCGTDCLMNWLEIRDVKNKGIPCQDCHESGWFAGFEENGVCNVCNGTKRVKGCINK
jgi:RecJ-like exonuclease